MIGLQRGIVKLELDQEGSWKIEFEREKDKLLEALGDYIIDIQHIGSTAISHIMAKPIIDIAIGLNSWENVGKVKEKLIENGYYYRENAGDSNRLFFAKGEETRRTHYLHVYEFGSLGWKNHIYFRDYLNTHKEYREKYNELKLGLQSLYENNRDMYTKRKAKFISEVLEQKCDINIVNTMEDIRYYSQMYNVPEADIIMIALNAMGIDSDLTQSRLRMKIALIGKDDDIFYLGIANHKESPFKMKDHEIFFDEVKIAKTYDIENDDCASSYFRKDNRVITLNSNRRSGCMGCRFCPNNLELNSEDVNLDTKEKLIEHFKNIMISKHISDLSGIERITICTGCFGAEEKTVSHLLLTYNVAKSLGFNGVLHYIGSEIGSEKVFIDIRNSVSRFMYTFTVECFTKRERMLKDVKSKIALSQYLLNMEKGKKYDFVVNIIYVLGLDSLEDTLKGLDRFINCSNYLPLINIFQPHVTDHYYLLDKDAWRMGYYLTVRKFVEQKYENTGITSQSWECYRPLWYFSFGKGKLECTRI